jgi:uncharacterized protein YkwD
MLARLAFLTIVGATVAVSAFAGGGSVGTRAARVKGPPVRHDSIERAVVAEVNRIRWEHGRRTLHLNHKLARAADAHSKDMASHGYFSHSSRNGGSWDRRLRHFVHSKSIGETIAWTSGRDPSQQATWVVKAWMESPEHRAALLSPLFRRVGIARRNGKLGGSRMTVFTADLSSRR